MDAGEAASLQAAHGGLHGDAERIEVLGAGSEWFTGMEYDGKRLVVRVTDPRAYGDAVLSTVEHPESVDVVAAPYSRVRMLAVRDQIGALLADLPGSWRGLGPGSERVHVELHGARGDVAELIRDRYGDEVEVTLGVHRYPLDAAAALPLRKLRATAAHPRIAAAVVPTSSSVVSGETLRGRIRFTNVSDDEIELATSLQRGRLLDRHGTVLAGFPGAIAGTDTSVRMPPGGTGEATFIVGTDCLDVRLGPILPAGEYWLTVPVDVLGVEVVPPLVPIRVV